MNQVSSDLRSLQDKYEKRLFFFALGLLKDNEQALDAVADVFIRLWKNNDLLAGVENIEQYLYSSVRHACYAVKKSRELLIDPAILAALAVEWEEKESLLMIRTELMSDLLDEWIKDLPDPHRSIIRRLYYENEKIMDICASMGLSWHLVKKYRSEALNQMRIKAEKAKKLNGLVLLVLVQLLNQ